jgi:hypothetical protein
MERWEMQNTLQLAAAHRYRIYGLRATDLPVPQGLPKLFKILLK